MLRAYRSEMDVMAASRGPLSTPKLKNMTRHAKFKIRLLFQNIDCHLAEIVLGLSTKPMEFFGSSKNLQQHSGDPIPKKRDASCLIRNYRICRGRGRLGPGITLGLYTKRLGMMWTKEALPVPPSETKR